MKNNPVTLLAKQSGRSKAAVSRVLNNCPGVDSAVREEILAQAAGMKELLPAEEHVDLAVILPDIPRFFWQKAQQAVISAQTGYSKRLHVYSSILHGGVLRSYLEQIEESGASAVIFAGIPDSAHTQRFAEFATRHLLIQLCEYTPIPNSFYVGSNPYDDGKRLGELLPDKTPEGDPCCVALLEQADSYNCRERNRGFSDAVQNRVRTVRLQEPDAGSLYPAQLAREIAETGLPITHVFGASGLTVPACDGLRKIKQRRIRYLGFEEPPRAVEYREKGILCACSVQNIELQMRQALQMAEVYLQTGTFPAQKFNFVASEIRG